MDKPGVVIVEKERIVALDLELQVSKMGYQFMAVFSSGEEFLESIDSLNPDLVLMDMDLTGHMNGLDTAGIIKENYNIPVVLITAFLEDLTSEEKAGLLPFGYLVKPLVPRELKLSLDMAIYRHSMELKLKESEDEYRNFFEYDLSANFIADKNGRIITCNSAFAGMLDFDSPIEASGTNLSRLFYVKSEGENFLSEVNIKKRLVMVETKFISRRGRVLSLVGTFMGKFDSSDELSGIIGYLHDTTEEKQLAEMLRQSQKMEAVGRLSGGIAHDFNNVLTIIIGYASLIGEKRTTGEDISKDLEGIQSAAKKASNLTRQLLTFSRRQNLKPEYLELNRLLIELKNMIHRLLGEEIIMRVYQNTNEDMVYADPGMLEQVLLNLAVNARDAMPDGGSLIIETSSKRLAETETSVMGEIPAGEYVVISVTDTGIGIEPEIQQKIFEPFFTTKPEYKGTGLGLASVYGIIKQSHGFIRFESELNRGTSFFIYLPVNKCELGVRVPGRIEEKIPVGDEQILLVEDDDQIREILMRTLSLAGYRPLAVENAGEALLLCERESDIRLIISDFMMPYLNGAQLISRLKKEYPEMKFILTSGFARSVIEEREFLEPEITFLQKPLDNNKLLLAIRSILDKT